MEQSKKVNDYRESKDLERDPSIINDCKSSVNPDIFLWGADIVFTMLVYIGGNYLFLLGHCTSHSITFQATFLTWEPYSLDWAKTTATIVGFRAIAAPVSGGRSMTQR